MTGLGYFWKAFLTKPSVKYFLHLLFIHFGWGVYDVYMTAEERLASKLR